MKSRFHLTCSTPVLLAGLLVAVLTPVALLAGSITGRVLDPDGLAVSNARIRLFDRNSGELRKTISRSDGSYSIQGVPDGQYLVEASTEDAALSSQQPIRVEGAQTVDLEMEISGTEVEVVVTASSTPLTLQEVAKALDVVDSEQIALRNEFALSEAIRNVPGVRVQQLRGPGSFTTVQTRGLRNHDTAVLIDGLRFRDAAGTQGDATAFYQNMNIVDTERVEFLRGSGSSLYGSHAIGGVMNISSSQGGGRPHGELRAEGGGLGMMRGVGRIGGGLAEDRFVYSSGFSHLNVVNGYRGGSPYRNNSAQGFAKYSFAPKVSLSGRVWGADAFLGLTESPAFPDSVVANFPASGNVPARPLPNSELSRFEQGMPFNAGSATFVPAQIDPDNRRVSSFLATALIFQQQLTPDSSYRLSLGQSLAVDLVVPDQTKTSTPTAPSKTVRPVQDSSIRCSATTANSTGRHTPSRRAPTTVWAPTTKLLSAMSTRTRSTSTSIPTKAHHRQIARSASTKQATHCSRRTRFACCRAR